MNIPTEAIGRITFSKWLVRRASFWWTAIPSATAFVFALAGHWSILLGWKAWLAPRFAGWLLVLQLAVILIFIYLIAFTRTPLRCAQSESDPDLAPKINRAVERFHIAWCWIWSTWALLYAFMAVEKLQLAPRFETTIVVASRDSSFRSRADLLRAMPVVDSLFVRSVREDANSVVYVDTTVRAVGSAFTAFHRRSADQMPDEIASVLRNLLNNINALIFGVIFAVMIRRPTPPMRLRAPSPAVMLVPIVFVLAILESGWQWHMGAGSGVDNPFARFSSMLAAVTMILFVSRLGGLYIAPPVWVRVALVIYGVMQTGWPSFPSEPTVAVAMTSLALLFKVLMFYVVDFALQEGDLLYYFYRVRSRGEPIFSGLGKDGWMTRGQKWKADAITALVHGLELPPDEGVSRANHNR